ncbi:amidase [Leptolyngbya sp. PCC 6406]|uniref:amidase n=1 Tax=Leptolyngbya sp. PCC 6406 TaxID=1173264 RepID=UPI0002ABA64B|nr:amidase [Leptolyngbya sp. PCC 6406]
MNAVDLAFTPALEQARLVRTGEVSPLDLVTLYLERIDRLNPQLGCYFTVMAEQALADAQAKTEYLATHPETLPPFFGVPLSVKDLNPVAGVPCSYGVRAARDRIAEKDDGIIPKLRGAGFILLGKTATSQLGSLPYTEPPGFPPARNPWNLDFTPGGSSGGAAAALAAGLCAISQGSDGGGSLRGPAFCCGLVGLKPSRGRISFAPVGERMHGLATNGPLGRTVADTAALLDTMAGYTTGDPYWLPNPEPSFLALSRQPVSPLRVALLTALPPLGTAHPTCQQAVLDTAHHLEALGHQVESVDPPDLSSLIEPFTIAWQCVVAEANVPWIVLERMNRWLLWRGWRTGSGAYLRAASQLQRVARRIVEHFHDYDLVLLPTYLHPTIALGEWRTLGSAQTLKNIIGWIAPCPPFNASGQPAIAIPTGFDDRNLPIGVQLVGRPGADATVLAVAAQLEQVQPWAHWRPQIAAH